AARAQLLTPAQMLAQLSHRFDFLVSRRRDVTERHRTIRAAIDWSYQLLSPELQQFFARLSVFRGGWTLAAAEAVCAPDPALKCRSDSTRSASADSAPSQSAQADFVPSDLDFNPGPEGSPIPDVLDLLA